MAYTNFELYLARLKIRDMVEKGNFGEENLEDTMVQILQLSEAQVRNILNNFKAQYLAKLTDTLGRLTSGGVSVQAEIDAIESEVIPT